MLRKIMRKIFTRKAGKNEVKYQNWYTKDLKRADKYFNKYVKYSFKALGYIDDEDVRKEGFGALMNSIKLHNLEITLSR